MASSAIFAGPRPIAALPGPRRPPLARSCSRRRSRPHLVAPAAMSAQEAMAGHYVVSVGEALYGRAASAAAPATRCRSLPVALQAKAGWRTLPACRLPGGPAGQAQGGGDLLVRSPAPPRLSAPRFASCPHYSMIVGSFPEIPT